MLISKGENNMEITINTNGNEVVEIWMANLFNRELEDTKDTINNEEMWDLGSDTMDAQLGHEDNIENLKEYTSILEDVLRQLNA